MQSHIVTGTSGFQVTSLPADSGRKYISEGNSFASIAAVKTIRGRKIAVINLNPYFHDIFYRQVEVSIRFQSKFEFGGGKIIKRGIWET